MLTKRKRLMRPRIGGAIYILPNLLTSGNLFFGYFSIIKSMQGDFTWAAGAIFLASIFDILDGRIARLTRATSEFGVQYDSLCDLISFGLAPALLMYQYALKDVGRMGWIFCFVFLACGALRLARFNVQSSIGKTKGDFTGLPIPMAACVIACFIGFLEDIDQFDGASMFIQEIKNILSSSVIKSKLIPFFSVFLGFLMVSNIAYRSHKSVKIKFIKPFQLLSALVVVVSLAAYKPPLFGWMFFTLYALSGPFEWILGWKNTTQEEDIFESLDQTSRMEPDDREE